MLSKILTQAWLHIFYKQPNFWLAEPQIIENHSNLASYSWASIRKILVTVSSASNQKFLATSFDFAKYFLFVLTLEPVMAEHLATLILKNLDSKKY